MATIVASATGGNWNATGAWVGGVAPTSTSDVQLKSTSGPITLNASLSCRSLDCTGYTNTLTHNTNVTLSIGDATAGLSNIGLKLVGGITYTKNDVNTSAFAFTSTNGTQQTIDSGGKTLGNVTVSGTGGSYLLSAALTLSANAAFTLTAGTFDTGGFDCSWGQFLTSGSVARTLTLQSSTVNLTTTGSVWSGATTGMVLNAGSSAIVVNLVSASARTFAGGGLTYNTLNYTLAGSPGGLTISGDNTFNLINFYDANNARTLTLTNGSTNTVQGLNVNGTSGKLISIVASAAGSASVSASGIISADYVALTGIPGVGGASFYAGTHSTNNGGNTNWVFTDPPTNVSSSDTGAFTSGSSLTTSASVSAGVGAETVTANAAKPSVGVSGGAVTVSATANNASAVVANISFASAASITSTAYNAAVATAVIGSAGVASITSTAYNAIVITAAVGTASAASITSTAYNAAVATAVIGSASAFSITATANDASAITFVTVSADDVPITVNANDASLSEVTLVGSVITVAETVYGASIVTAAIGTASAVSLTSTAYNAAVATAAVGTASAFTIAVLAHDAAVSTDIRPDDAASAMSTAYDAVVAVLAGTVDVAVESIAVIDTVYDAVVVTATHISADMSMVTGIVNDVVVTIAVSAPPAVIVGTVSAASVNVDVLADVCSITSIINDVGIRLTTGYAVVNSVVNDAIVRIEVSAGYAAAIGKAFDRNVVAVHIRAVYHRHTYQAVYRRLAYIAVHRARELVAERG